jgi:phosphoenolpyruvate carboxylase
MEDAAFSIVIWKAEDHCGYQRKADAKGKKEELIDFLENFNVRTVLTAHPTQFYPGQS